MNKLESNIESSEKAVLSDDLFGIWHPIESAPRDGTWILLAGPSGYTTTPLRAEVGRYYPQYRPLQPWQTHANDSFTDGGPLPTHWHPLPSLPNVQAKP